jgi:hypothetical protein
MNAQDQATTDVLTICTDILNALRTYGEKYNVEVEGTTAEVIEAEGIRPKVIVTVPKYIDEDHRENMEQLAIDAAAHSPLKPLVQFVYEQSAG